MSKLTIKEKFGFSLGEIGGTLSWQGMMFYLALFYSDIYGLPSYIAGFLIFLPKFLDALVDPLVGAIADRTETRWGKFRPFLLWYFIPYSILLVLMYYTPMWSLMGKIIWAAGTYLSFMILYSLLMTPYNALGGVVTDDHIDRTSLQSYRFIMAFAGGLIVRGLTNPLVKYFGGYDPTQTKATTPEIQHGLQNGFFWTMVVFGVLSMIAFFITFLSTKERVTPPKDQTHGSLKQDFKHFILLKPGIILVVAVLFTFMILGNLGDYWTIIKQHTGLLVGIEVCVVALYLLVAAGIKKMKNTDDSFILTIKKQFSEHITITSVLLLIIAIAYMQYNDIFATIKAKKDFMLAMVWLSYAISVISIILYSLVLYTRKTIEIKKDNDFIDLLDNKPWMVMFLASTLNLIYVGVFCTAIAYYFKYYVATKSLVLFGWDSGYDLMSTFNVFGSIIIILVLSFPTTTFLVKRFGKKNTLIGCFSLVTLSIAGFFICNPTDVLLILFFQFIQSAAAACTMPIMWSMYADAADFSEYNKGRRATGLVYSAVVLGQKVGIALGGAIPLWVLGSKYDGLLAVQPDNVIQGVRVSMSLIPGAIALLTMAACFFYPLTDKEMDKIQSELTERRKLNEAKS